MKNWRLGDNETHVWSGCLDVSRQERHFYFRLLSPEEKSRAARFRLDKDQRHFIVARGILKSLICKYTGIDSTKVRFRYGKYGKPYLTCGSPISFNSSRSKGIGVFGFTANRSIGVDVEFIRDGVEYEDIAKRFFSRRETDNLLNLNPENRREGFFNCWTRKEAIIKAIGKGLSIPLDSFEVSLKPNEPVKLLATDWDTDAEVKWSLVSFVPKKNYIAAIAEETQRSHVSFYKLSKEHLVLLNANG